MAKKVSQTNSLLSVQNVILASVSWGIIALLIFLLGSPIIPRPAWYSIATYMLENVAFIAAAVLCFRNWKSPQIVSGRIVWLLFAVGMLCYFIGNLLLGWWELVWQQAPDVSPGDLFYLLTYLLLGIGMMLAVVSKRLTLTPVQWIIVIAITIGGTILAYYVAYYEPDEVAYGSTPHSSNRWEQPAWVMAVDTPTAQMAAGPAVQPWQLPASPALPDALSPAGVLVQETAPAVPEPPPEAVPEEPSTAPEWVSSLDAQLANYLGIVSFLYLAGDVFLVAMASTLLMAFWGGRFSMSWRFIAAAGFSFYIADMAFYYALAYVENYETGALPEVFWIFSGVLFCIGAALEYNLSTRSRRSRRRS